MEKREQRQVRCIPAEFQTRTEENGDLYISGYFSVFDSIYEICEGATESIASSAFDGALADDIRCLINHESMYVLGRTKAGTLELHTDSRGLWGDVKINQNDRDAMNLYERVKRGDVDQCSFGFEILEEEFKDQGNTVHWTIKKVRLYEVSVVTFPAYQDTSVTARSEQLTEIKRKSTDAFKQRIVSKLKGEQK